MDRKAAVKTKKKSKRIHRVDTVTYQNKFALPLNESFKKLKDETSGQKNGEIGRLKVISIILVSK